jgi:hypothetical protein
MEQLIPFEAGDDPDVDVPYRFIILRPEEQEELSKSGLLALTEGIHHDKDLDAFTSESSEALNAALIERFSWSSVQEAIVPGFSREFDGNFTHPLF